MKNEKDEKIIRELQAKLLAKIQAGDKCGPFYAAVVDGEGKIVAESANSVVPSDCSHNHAEMNAISLAEKQLGTWNLSGRGFTLYTTAEPCMMCVGGILWSGIERVVFGVATGSVERITGFDEGFKPNWREEFARRHIEVIGPVASEVGESVLAEYMRRAGVVYTPKRGSFTKCEMSKGGLKAVVFIDVQKDFIDGALRNEKAIEVTPKIVEFAKECVSNGYKLYATRDTHKKTVFADGAVSGVAKPVSGYLASLEGRKLPVEHCLEGTEGWEIDARLVDVLLGKVTLVNKPTFGSFVLAEIIKEDMQTNKCLYDEIIICGFCTDICVISNALILRAKFPNTRITIKGDLCAGVTLESHNAALTTAKMCQIDVI